MKCVLFLMILNSKKHEGQIPKMELALLFQISLLLYSEFCPTRPERAEAPSPGHRPGLLRTQTCRPVRAKAFKYRAIYKAFALTGRLADCYYTQGVALG